MFNLSLVGFFMSDYDVPLLSFITYASVAIHIHVLLYTEELNENEAMKSYDKVIERRPLALKITTAVQLQFYARQ